MFKLYPWEWLFRESFGQYLLTAPLQLIEPAWKIILSNKAILPILWELFPEHPNLLPAYYDSSNLSHPYISKPIFAREGANITIYHGDKQDYSSGNYDEEPLIYQAYCPLPKFDDVYPVIGSWVIGGKAGGIGIREDSSPITQNSSCFVPHYYE
jgi:glutathionylspermidine synthase